MDVSGFLSGRFLTHLDLPSPTQKWTIKEVKEELVGDDLKAVVYFREHSKGLGLNKTNLRAIAERLGVDTTSWVGSTLDVYKDRTEFQGRPVDCIRVRVSPLPASEPPAANPFDRATAKSLLGK